MSQSNLNEDKSVVKVTKMGHIKVNDSGELEGENVPEELEKVIQASKPKIRKLQEPTRTLTPRRSASAKEFLLKNYTADRGLLTQMQAKKIISLYDTEKSGGLEPAEGVCLIQDLIEVCDLTQTILSFMPLTSSRQSFLEEFARICFQEFDSNKDGYMNEYDLIVDGGYHVFLRNVFEKKKYEMNPARKTLEEKQKRDAQMRAIDDVMMSYEFDEAFTGLMDSDAYRNKFAQSNYTFKNI